MNSLEQRYQKKKTTEDFAFPDNLPPKIICIKLSYIFITNIPHQILQDYTLSVIYLFSRTSRTRTHIYINIKANNPHQVHQLTRGVHVTVRSRIANVQLNWHVTYLWKRKHSSGPRNWQVTHLRTFRPALGSLHEALQIAGPDVYKLQRPARQK